MDAIGDLFNSVKRDIEDKGDTVLIDEPICLLWLADHSICKGCPSELGCTKYTSAKYVLVGSMLYKPNSFSNFMRMGKQTAEILEKIFHSKTVEEVDGIVDSI
jgi:hypothetical protein